MAGGGLGLAISFSKSQLMVFSRSNLEFRDFQVMVGGVKVKLRDCMKYLGVMLDRTLPWLPHTRLEDSRATKAINVIKALAKVSWAASAGKSNLTILDRVQFSFLRSVLGCMGVTATSILLSETAESPLLLRRAMLCRRFLIRNFSW